MKKWMWVVFRREETSFLFMVTEDLFGWLKEVLWNKERATPDKIEEREFLLVDPGGPIARAVPGYEFDIDGYRFELKAEHYYKILYLTQPENIRVFGQDRDIATFPTATFQVVLPLEILGEFRQIMIECEDMRTEADAANDIFKSFFMSANFVQVMKPEEDIEA